MLVAERSNLTPVKVLIDNALTRLEVFENREGNIFLSSLTSRPEGLVYYATTPALLRSFIENSITLQMLFDDSPSILGEFSSGDKITLYSLKDMDIELAFGDKTIKQLIDDNTMEAW